MRRLIAIVVVVAAAVGVLGARGTGRRRDRAAQPGARRVSSSDRFRQSQRNHCQLADPATEGTIIAGEAASIRAMARCYSVNDLATLWYVLMDSPDSTARLYRKYSGTLRPRGAVSRRRRRVPGRDHLGLRRREGRRDAGCYYAATNLDGTPHEESAVLVWTYTAGNILGLAETTHGDADAAALKDWWRDDAGPLSHPTRVPRGSPTGPCATGTRSKRCSRTCRSRSAAPAWSEDRATDGAFAPARLWANAVVTCKSGIHQPRLRRDEPRRRGELRRRVHADGRGGTVS